MYEVDKDKVDHVLGVHFPQNNNSLSQGTVGIEIKILKKNNLTVIESNTSTRYRIENYDQATNFCEAEIFDDASLNETFGTTVDKDKSS